MAVLSIDANERLEAYLADVADVLSGDGHGLTDIRNIVESLREQIYELATDGGQRSATLTDIELTLAEMEPPEAFRAVSRVLAMKAGRRSTQRVLAYFAVAMSLGTMLTIFMVPAADWLVPYHPKIYGVGQITALAAGVASWSEPLGRFGAVCAALFLIAAILAPK